MHHKACDTKEELMKYKLKDFLFNTKQRTLSKDGLTQLLTPKTYKLLLLFTEAEGSVVSKDQIREQVWANRVVSETTLYKVIQRLRSFLGDNGLEQAAIKTIHGEGYLMTLKSRKVNFWNQWIHL